MPEKDAGLLLRGRLSAEVNFLRVARPPGPVDWLCTGCHCDPTRRAGPLHVHRLAGSAPACACYNQCAPSVALTTWGTTPRWISVQEQYTPRPLPKRSMAPFDAMFAVICERTDISASAKLVYSKLTTMKRVGYVWTQVEIGERTGMSRQGVWRALKDLIAVGLVTMQRHGQGYPNSYTLHGVDEDDLYGTANTPDARLKRIRAVRFKQLSDLYGKMCLRCGDTRRLEIDHVIPVARGGPDVFSNLQLLCHACNQSKGARTADYRQSPGVPLAGSPGPA